MTETQGDHDVLREEWLARCQAAEKHRTAARLRAAETAFRAYAADLAARVPAPRAAAADEDVALGAAPSSAGLG